MVKKFFVNEQGGISVAEIDEEQDAVWIDGEMADQYETLDDFFNEQPLFDTLQEAAASV